MSSVIGTLQSLLEQPIKLLEILGLYPLVIEKLQQIGQLVGKG